MVKYGTWAMDSTFKPRNLSHGSSSVLGLNIRAVFALAVALQTAARTRGG